MASDELLRLIASSLRDLGSGPREAFILHAIEGFTVEEIVAITGLPPNGYSPLFLQRVTTCARSPGLAKQFQGRFVPTGAA